ncbi:hypothetical protein ALC56_08224 [Trachymyrmex septentrionalis]|uniref:Uncharacterized protein n=1 Tax=Trachymyrmex septentrionalis TaxID=34720 RepID=A0A151JVA3_9HYME|nr:hypothetical protein ALC56_08224 [Trachymyrmex septentrionalis]
MVDSVGHIGWAIYRELSRADGGGSGLSWGISYSFKLATTTVSTPATTSTLPLRRFTKWKSEPGTTRWQSSHRRSPKSDPRSRTDMS